MEIIRNAIDLLESWAFFNVDWQLCINYCYDANAAGADSATLKITDAKLYGLVVALSVENNEKLRKQFSEGFKRHACWNKYKVSPNKNEAGTNDDPK